MPRLLSTCERFYMLAHIRCWEEISKLISPSWSPETLWFFYDYYFSINSRKFKLQHPRSASPPAEDEILHHLLLSNQLPCLQYVNPRLETSYNAGSSLLLHNWQLWWGGKKNPIIIQYKDCFAELLILLQSAVVNILVWKRNMESDESALYW